MSKRTDLRTEFRRAVGPKADARIDCLGYRRWVLTAYDAASWGAVTSACRVLRSRFPDHQINARKGWED